jgi:hypothetical protein
MARKPNRPKSTARIKEGKYKSKKGLTDVKMA